MTEKIFKYESDEIIISYNSKLCIHAAECANELPSVFNPKNKFETTGFLFTDTSGHYVLPKLVEGELDQAFDEIELLGVVFCHSFMHFEILHCCCIFFILES